MQLAKLDDLGSLALIAAKERWISVLTSSPPSAYFRLWQCGDRLVGQLGIETPILGYMKTICVEAGYWRFTIDWVVSCIARDVDLWTVWIDTDGEASCTDFGSSLLPSIWSPLHREHLGEALSIAYSSKLEEIASSDKRCIEYGDTPYGPCGLDDFKLPSEAFVRPPCLIQAVR